jgi:hypothetical protein
MKSLSLVTLIGLYVSLAGTNQQQSASNFIVLTVNAPSM